MVIEVAVSCEVAGEDGALKVTPDAELLLNVPAPLSDQVTP